MSRIRPVWRFVDVENTQKLRATTQQPVPITIAPVVELRSRDLIASRNLGQYDAIAKAFLNDPDFLFIRPTATTAAVT